MKKLNITIEDGDDNTLWLGQNGVEDWGSTIYITDIDYEMRKSELFDDIRSDANDQCGGPRFKVWGKGLKRYAHGYYADMEDEDIMKWIKTNPNNLKNYFSVNDPVVYAGGSSTVRLDDWLADREEDDESTMKKLNITKEQFDESKGYPKGGYPTYVVKEKLVDLIEGVPRENPMFADLLDVFEKYYGTAEYDKLMVWLKQDNKSAEIMRKLNITKEAFEKSRYLQKKYGKLEYVSESGKLFKTDKGKVLKFNEGSGFAAVGDFNPEEPEGKFILTLRNEEGHKDEISFYMDVQEDWGNVNTIDGTCYYHSGEPFDGIGWGNDDDGYEKIVKVYSVDLKKPMKISDFALLCEQYVDWFSA